eukprot:scaffold208517_cov31-Tisochrysis_lutea.AAC.3
MLRRPCVTAKSHSGGFPGAGATQQSLHTSTPSARANEVKSHLDPLAPRVATSSLNFIPVPTAMAGPPRPSPPLPCCPACPKFYQPPIVLFLLRRCPEV